MSRSLMRLRQLATTLVGLGMWLLAAAEDDVTSAVTLADANFPTKCTENTKSASAEIEPAAAEEPAVVIEVPVANDQPTDTTQKDDEPTGLAHEDEEITEIPTTTPAPYQAPKKEKQPEFYVDDV